MRIKLGIPLSLDEVSTAVKGIRNNSSNVEITHLSTDSREVKGGDLFIPLQGENFSGETFLEEAKQRGGYSLSCQNEKADVIVTDCKKALLALAEYYVKKLPNIIYKVAITGSVGKTTVKEFIKTILSTQYIVHANEKNFNNNIGMSMSVLSAPIQTEVLVMEMGMNGFGEIREMSKCLSPSLSVITNIGTSHIGRLGSRKGIAIAKMEVVDGMQSPRIIIPENEPLLKGLKEIISFSVSNANADYYSNIKDSVFSIYRNKLKYSDGRVFFRERHIQECLTVASAVAIECNVTPINIRIGIGQITPSDLRHTIIVKQGYIFISDCYNASIESIFASYDTVKNINNPKGNSLILGDVSELGNYEESILFTIGAGISSKLFENLFLFGKRIDHIMQGAISSGFKKENIHLNYDLSRPEVSAMQIQKHCKSGELILMKASRSVRLERILDYFKGGNKE